MEVVDMGQALALYVQRWRALPEHVRAQSIADGQAAKLARCPQVCHTVGGELVNVIA